MNHFKKISGLLLIGILMTSCVSQKEFDKVKADYNTCLEHNGQYERTISELNAKNQGLNDQLALLKSNNASMKEALDKCIEGGSQGNVNMSKLIDEINSSNKYIKQLVESKFKNDSMNLALSNKLKRSLSDLNDQDVNVKVLKGVVFISLSDNMLYKSGSYEIAGNAQDVLAKVATVINDYKDYDVLVEGNTDNVPISKGCISDNWDLSSLRATAVVRELQSKYGVNPARMTAGGRSFYNPKTDNNSAAGRAENRRTEIVVMPKLDEFLKLMDQAPVKN